MPTRQHLKSVLYNFLGTYTSRYSDHQGYWLFGFIVDKPGTLEIDLLSYDPIESDSPVNTAARAASRVFGEQMKKAGLSLVLLREAKLTIDILPTDISVYTSTYLRHGHNLDFCVAVVSDLGRAYRSGRQIFVAPHDPRYELNSGRHLDDAR